MCDVAILLIGDTKITTKMTYNVSTLVVAQESYGIGDTSDVRASKTEALIKDVLGNNQFASLDSSECISSDDDEYLCDVEMTASAQRILRDRPVKPSKKVEEMLNISSNAGGRGNRGRKGRRGRGNIG